MLSIVIPSYCREDLLSRCLATTTPNAPAGTQIIVVDDGSKNETISRAASRFAHVEVIRLPRRRGFCVAANVGIRAARGDIVELLNDDTEVQAGWAEAALACFTDPAVGAVAPLVLIGPEGRRIDSAGDRYDLGGAAQKRGHGLPLSAEFLLPRPVFGASAAAGFFRRQALDQVGGFPEEFSAYFEDVDLAFRLQRAGYQVLFEPRSRVLHRVSASYGKPARRLVVQQSCNEERVFWRNMPRQEMMAAVPRHLAVLLAKACRRWNEGCLTPWLFGRLQVLREIPALIHHRAKIQPLGPVPPVTTWQVEKFLGKRRGSPPPEKPLLQHSFRNRELANALLDPPPA